MSHIVNCDRCGWEGPETDMTEKHNEKSIFFPGIPDYEFHCPQCDHYIYGQYEESYNKKKYLS